MPGRSAAPETRVLPPLAALRQRIRDRSAAVLQAATAVRQVPLVQAALQIPRVVAAPAALVGQVQEQSGSAEPVGLQQRPLPLKVAPQRFILSTQPTPASFLVPRWYWLLAGQAVAGVAAAPQEILAAVAEVAAACS